MLSRASKLQWQLHPWVPQLSKRGGGGEREGGGWLAGKGLKFWVVEGLHQDYKFNPLAL